METQKRKERDYSQSNKLLISKIKEIEGKYQLEKNKSRQLEKTVSKGSQKGLSTYQSISLDSSLYREKESPSVSCFIRDDTDLKHKRKELKIDT